MAWLCRVGEVVPDIYRCCIPQPAPMTGWNNSTFHGTFSRCGGTHTPFQLPVNCHSSKCRSSSFIVYRLPGGRRLQSTHTPPAYIPPNEPPTKQEGKSAPRVDGDDDDDDAWASAASISTCLVLRLLLESGHQPGTLKGGMHRRQPTGHPKKGHRRCRRGCYWRANCFPSC